MRNTYLAVIMVASGFGSCERSESDPTPALPPPVVVPDSVGITARVITEGLTQPWEIIWGTDNQLWMTERGGRISRVSPTTGALTTVTTVPDVVANGEGGLLGMVLHPQFATVPHLFLVYNYTGGGAYREKLVRYTWNGSTLTSPLVLLENIPAASIHNGSRLLISEDKIYMTTGDAANTALSQNAASLNGKILRLNLDGSIPTDNPVAGSAVWTTGHRNSQGLAMVAGKLFASEHGPETDDEINIVEKGRNYGWPAVRGFCNDASETAFCAANNVRKPIRTWTPTIAVSGMEYYNSDTIPQWRNSLLMATLKNTRLYQLKLNAAQTEVLSAQEFYNGQYGRLRDVAIGANGRVYLCTGNGSNDKIIELRRQ